MGRKPKAEAEKKSNIVKDRVGEKTDLFLCPECSCAMILTDCFANINGRCTALKETEGNIPCVFYKSTEAFFSDALRKRKGIYLVYFTKARKLFSVMRREAIKDLRKRDVQI